MNKHTKQILKNIPSMDMNDLEILKQKVYNSLLEVKEKNEVVSAIDKKMKNINIDDALVEVSEIELD